MGAIENTIKLRELFTETSKKFNLRGILGITRYKPVYDGLLAVQKEHIKEITEGHHNEFMVNGFIVSIAYVYPDGVIENIGLSREGAFDKAAWNIYTGWYKALNKALNETSRIIAKTINGIHLQATFEGMPKNVKSVKEYFPDRVSHRVHAEQSGIGWRGRNSLIVNPVYSCMIRLAGVITLTPLYVSKKIDNDCGSCISCLEVCAFLKHQEKLADYREQCLAYINWLGLDDEVCGKCIKACVHSSRMNNLEPPFETRLDSIFYTNPSNSEK